MQTGLCYDDVLLVPQYSEISSRHKINITSPVGNFLTLDTPIVAAPMDTVCEADMAIALHKQGAFGILHRYNKIEEQLKMYLEVQKAGAQCGTAIGTGDDCLERAAALAGAGCEVICIDVAHGHHANVMKTISELRNMFKGNIHIMTGNVATPKAFEALSEWGADSVRVGVGGGSVCSTRIVTGHGVPNFSAVMGCAHSGGKAAIIADGGIKNSGDMVKAFAAGADVVMVGSLLAGTHEAPGEWVEDENGQRCKKMRGMASSEAQSHWRGWVSVAEGVSRCIPDKGPVKDVVKQLSNGIKSGLSYSGCSDIQMFPAMAEFIMQTSLGMGESIPHLKGNKIG
jgi:IMP dehydrogenase